MRQPIVLAALALSSTLVACGADNGTPELDDTAVGDTKGAFSTAPGEPNHEAITKDALSFLRPDLLLTVIAGNVSTDVEFFLVNANHFDDCNFTGGSQVVADQQAAAVSDLDPADPTPEADVRAAVAFGHSIHSVQDFYAHTNWVELGGETLVDESLTPFPALTPYSEVPSSGFTVIQGPKPKNTAITRRTDAAYPEYAVVTYKAKIGRTPGLVSGTVDYEPGDFCPPQASMTHDALNKDKSTLPGRAEQFASAKALATLQTRHEWCRFEALTRAAWGDGGASRLAAWIAPDATPPDCSPE
jgi:hypothetical protein